MILWYGIMFARGWARKSFISWVLSYRMFNKTQCTMWVKRLYTGSCYCKSPYVYLAETWQGIRAVYEERTSTACVCCLTKCLWELWLASVGLPVSGGHEAQDTWQPVQKAQWHLNYSVKTSSSNLYIMNMVVSHIKMLACDWNFWKSHKLTTNSKKLERIWNSGLGYGKWWTCIN